MISVAAADAGSDAVAQRRQRQHPRWSSRSEAIAAALTCTELHQHGVSNEPLRAGAQSFGPPQCGHWRLGVGVADKGFKLTSAKG